MIFRTNRMLALFCGAFLFSLLIFSNIGILTKLISALILLITAFTVIKLKKSFRNFSIMLCGVAVSLLFSLLAFDLAIAPLENKTSGKDNITAVVDSVDYISENVAYLDVKVKASECFKGSYKLDLTVFYPVNTFECGDVIKGNIEYIEFQSEDDFDFKSYNAAKGVFIYGQVKGSDLTTIERRATLSTMLNKIRYGIKSTYYKYTAERETAALLSALTIGDKEGLEDEVKRDFSRLGCSHILAISGLHLSVIMSCIMMLSELFNIRRRLCSGVVIFLCLFFIFISGASYSVLRAGIMFIIMNLSVFLRRRGDSITSLFGAVTLIVLFSPSSVNDIGLILSFSSTLGIVVIMPAVMKRLNREAKSLVRRCLDGVIISLVTTTAAIAFSLIPMALCFDEISIISPLANLLLSPFVTVILFITVLFIVLSPISFTAFGIGRVLDLIVGLMYKIVGALGALDNIVFSLKYPFAPMVLIVFIVVAIIVILLAKRRVWYLLPLCCYFLCFVLFLYGYNIDRANAVDAVFYSDINNRSDAILLSSKEGNTVIAYTKDRRDNYDDEYLLLSDELYQSEIDRYILPDYTNNSVATLRKLLCTEHILELILPKAENDFDKTAAAEIMIYADACGAKIKEFEYETPFYAGCVEVTIHTPKPLSGGKNSIGACTIKNGENRIAYYGRGYEYDDSVQYDILFFGGNGTTSKKLECFEVTSKYLISSQNTAELLNENCESFTVLGVDAPYSKIRIE